MSTDLYIVGGTIVSVTEDIAHVQRALMLDTGLASFTTRFGGPREIVVRAEDVVAWAESADLGAVA